MDVSTSTPTATASPLRQRMLDDMRMRQFAEHTQEGYIRAVRKLSAFLGRSPHTATAEDLRRFQLHLVDTGTGPVAAVSSLGAYATPARRHRWPATVCALGQVSHKP